MSALHLERMYARKPFGEMLGMSAVTRAADLARQHAIGAETNLKALCKRETVVGKNVSNI